MKIGTRISPDWLDRPKDLQFLKQIGVDVVDITLDICPAYKETGRLSREGVERVAEVVDQAGLKVERANSLSRYLRSAFLGGPEVEQEIDNLVHNIGLCGKFGFPVVGVQCFQAGQLAKADERLYSWVEGRGGYRHKKVDLREALDRPLLEASLTHEELWERTLKIYRAAIPAAEEAGVKIAMHGNDPPVPSINGVAQILYDFDAFDRLFSEVPSDHNGMTFCVGTRYESGQDVFEGIRRFGEKGKIFHVHFRNVKGTIPATGGYQEVFPDSGDLNMFEVAKALHDVAYEGAIDYDHIMKLATDGPEGREYIAFCVGQMKGHLDAIRAA